MTTSGPNYPGTGADDSAVGTLTWSSPGNIVSDNNTDAITGTTGGPSDTHYLKGTGFGFAIAADQQIDGITVEFEKYRSGSTGTVKDAVVKLVIGGTVSGSNLADTGTTWPTSRTTTTYGGASSLWGLTPTYSDINGATFGVVLSATVTKTSGKGQHSAVCDFVRVTITHSTAGGGGPTVKTLAALGVG